LKTEYPERFHFLLSNHELAELGDYPICKSRRMLNVLFRCGINEMYGAAGEEVRSAYLEFLASCPLAVRVGEGVFVTHSCPDGCGSRATYLILPVGPKLTQADVIGRVKSLHRS